jgi:hypothetical protein
MTATTSNKTIFILNPNTKEGFELYNYAKNFRIDIDYEMFKRLNDEGTRTLPLFFEKQVLMLTWALPLGVFVLKHESNIEKKIKLPSFFQFSQFWFT